MESTNYSPRWTDEVLHGMHTELLYCPVCDKTYSLHKDARNCCKPSPRIEFVAAWAAARAGGVSG